MADWVIDPKNPNRATYTSPDGTVHEAFKQPQTQPEVQYEQSPNGYVPPKGARMGPVPGQEAVVTAPDMSWGQRFGEAYDRATSMAGTGEIGALSRGLEDLFNINDRYQQAMMGGTADQREAYRDAERVRKVRDVRSMWAALDEADPNWRKDDNILGNVSRLSASILGDIVGNANPDYLIGGGGTVAERMAVQGGVNAGVDAAIQGQEISQGIEDSFDPVRAAKQFLAGVVIQGGGEVLGKTLKGLKDAFFPRTPDINFDFDSDDFARETIEGSQKGGPGSSTAEADYAQEVNDALAGGASKDQINAIAERYGKPAFGPELDDFLKGGEAPVVASDGGMITRRYRTPEEEDVVQNAIGTVANKLGIDSPEKLSEAVGSEDFQRRVRAELIDRGESLGLLDKEMAPDLTATVETSIEPQRFMPVSKDSVETHVAELTKDWKNAPDFEIVDRVDQISDPNIKEAVNDPDVLGFYGPDGKVRIVSGNLRSTDEIAPALFHEALGHHGLAQKFGNGLDTFLDRLYENSPDMKRMVDEWDADYGAGYGDVPMSVKVEEVLAKMSEGGELKQSILDKIKDFLKQYARQAGINLEFSEREIRSILASAHDAVTRGPKTAETPSGVRMIYAGRKGQFTPEEKESGWFMGPDGMMRREISDDWDIINREGWDNLPEGIHGRLEDVVDHPELFRVYPQLKDTTVIKDDIGPTGSYDEATNTLRVKPYLDDNELTRVILHEVQHGIQGIEDFARGGNPATALDKAEGNALRSIGEAVEPSLRANYSYYADIRDQMDGIFNDPVYAKEMRNLWQNKMEGKVSLADWTDDAIALQRRISEDKDLSMGQSMDVAQAINAIGYTRGQSFGDVMETVIRKSDKILDDMRGGIEAVNNPQLADVEYRDALKAANNLMTRNALTPKTPGHEAYRNLFGEVEARDVESRIGLTQAERDLIPPYSTSDVARHQYIFDFDAGDSIGRQSTDGKMDDRIHAERMKRSNAAAKAELDRRMAADADIPLVFDEATGNWVTSTRRPANDIKSMKRRDEDRRVGNIDLDRVFTRNDISDAIKEAAKGYDAKTVSHDETVAQARELGLTPSAVANKRKISTEEASAYIVGAMDVLARQGEEISRLTDKVIAGEATPNDVARLAHATGVYGDIVPSVMKTRSEIGRALNAMKISYRRGREAEEILRLIEDSGSAVFSDPNLLLKFAKQLKAVEGDEVARAKLAKDVFSPKAEDVLFSLWYNIDLLSRPSTQYNNFMGTLENLIGELTSKTLAVPIGQVRKLAGNSDRVAIRELMSRVAGMGVGAVEGLMNAPRAFVLARPITGVNKEAYRPAPIFDIMDELTKNAPGIARYPALAGAGAIETTSRVMATVDEFFRAIAHNQEVYGQAARMALQDKEPGSFAEKFYSYKRKPTEAKISDIRLEKGLDSYADPKNKARHAVQDEATSQADIATFRDRSSPLIGDLERRLRPNINDNPATRAAKVAVRIIVPFIRMGDAMMRSTIRTTPILGMLDRYNRADFKAGGARRDVVLGRMALGLGLGYIAWAQAMNGTRSGGGPTDPERRQELEDSGWKPNAIRQEDGSWVSKRGLGPFNAYMNTVASITEAVTEGEIDEETAGDQMAHAFRSVMAAFADNAGLQQLFSIVSPNASQEESEAGLSGLFSSFAIPGALQSYTQNFADTSVRSLVPKDAPASSKGKTFEQRLEGKVKSAYPGLSEELPQRYDVYGRPVTRPGGVYGALTANREGKAEKDKVVKELARLAAMNGGKALIDQPQKTLSMGSKKKGTFVQKKLTEDEFQRYKGLSGYYIRYIVGEQMKGPAWKKMSDAEKIELISGEDGIKAFARKAARTQLFIQQDEPEEEPETAIPEEETVIE